MAVHFEDGYYWAEAEGMPGCFATGDSLEELTEAMTEAVELYTAV